MKLEHVLIATDFSEPSRDSARWAALHFAPDARLTLLHVIQTPRLPSFLEGLFGPPQEAIRRARDSAADTLAALAAELDAGRTRTDLRTGNPPDVIAEAAASLRADVIVVGRHGSGKGRAGVLGSTAERLAGVSPAPVLLARGAPPGAPRRLLAAVDESELTIPVLRWARLLARRFHARVIALYATQPMLYGPVSFAPAAGAPHRLTDEVSRRAARWLERSLRDAGFEPGAAGTLVARGQAALVIPEEAQRTGADLILMGSRGAGAARRLLLGSTASVVLRSAAVPVLVVPPGS